MADIHLTHASFNKAKKDVDAARHKLTTDRDKVDGRVTAFLGAGWTGSAAESFQEGWGDWKAAADDVLEGLQAMRYLLDAAHRDFIEADQMSQEKLDQLAARLIDRLEG